MPRTSSPVDHFLGEVAEVREYARVSMGALRGGHGYSRELPVEKIYRDVRVAQIYEGTSDVQRILIISRQLLREAKTSP